MAGTISSENCRKDMLPSDTYTPSAQGSPSLAPSGIQIFNSGSSSHDNSDKKAQLDRRPLAHEIQSSPATMSIRGGRSPPTAPRFFDPVVESRLDWLRLQNVTITAHAGQPQAHTQPQAQSQPQTLPQTLPQSQIKSQAQTQSQPKSEFQAQSHPKSQPHIPSPALQSCEQEINRLTEKVRFRKMQVQKLGLEKELEELREQVNSLRKPVEPPQTPRDVVARVGNTSVQGSPAAADVTSSIHQTEDVQDSTNSKLCSRCKGARDVFAGKLRGTAMMWGLSPTTGIRDLSDDTLQAVFDGYMAKLRENTQRLESAKAVRIQRSKNGASPFPRRPRVNSALHTSNTIAAPPAKPAAFASPQGRLLSNEKSSVPPEPTLPAVCGKKRKSGMLSRDEHLKKRKCVSG